MIIISLIINSSSSHNGLELRPPRRCDFKQVRGLDSYIKVIKWWLINHEPSDDFWIRNPIGNVSDRALSELKTSVPSLGELRRDFQTFIKIYKVLETFNERWDQVRVGEINSLIEQ